MTTRERICRLLCAGAIALAACSGCGPNPAPPDAGAAQAPTSVARPPVGLRVPPSKTPQAPATEAAPSGHVDGAEDIWMACYSGDAKVGYMHTRIEPVAIDGRKRIRWTYEDYLVIQRWGDRTEVRTRFSSLETPDGRLVEFRSEILAGAGAMTTEGEYRDGKLRMTTAAGGRTQRQEIPWDPNWGGFFADQQSLRARPMKPGQTRRLKALLPLVNRAGEIRMTAAGYEAVSLPAGSRQLLRIDAVTDLGTTQMKTVLWTDRAGTVWKTRDLQIKLEAVRTTRKEALAGGTTEAMDLGRDVVIRVARPLDRPHQTRRVVYRATLKEGDIGSVFATGLGQTVRVIDQHTAEVTVRAVRPDRPAQAPAGESDRPTSADKEPSGLIQSDDARVVAMAERAARGLSDPWRIACALERYVRQKIRLKDYSTALATAAEVARSLQGDCTEHAMLLAALCRARAIPARVAVGLVHSPADSGFAYHMWTEAWIRDRWVPLDATLGQGGVGAAHLKFTHSSMTGMNAFAELLTVIHAIGRLQLEIVSVEYESESGT